MPRRARGPVGGALPDIDSDDDGKDDGGRMGRTNKSNVFRKWHYRDVHGMATTLSTP